MAYTTINKSTDYFNTKLYNGTGSAQSITGVGFQPDWLWQKSRSNSQDGRIFDAVRGGSKLIYPSLTNAESTDAQLITSFDSDGFTMGSSGSNVNDSGTTNVAWNWKANGQGSSNTDGSINTTYTSANTTSGFSIVKYTGTGSNATVGHGLGVAPSLIITKSLVATQEWCVYHKSLGATKYLFLNETSAEQTGSVYWQDTAPTSSVFSVGASGPTNSTSAMIAYCFAEKTGYSKFGSYTGNGNADGSFIFCGFKPAFVMIKRTNASDNWNIFDSKRVGYNWSNYRLFANSSSAEETAESAQRLDIVSNGFKLRDNETDVNGNGNPHIYIAFAEAPLVGSNNVPATAR